MRGAKNSRLNYVQRRKTSRGSSASGAHSEIYTPGIDYLAELVVRVLAVAKFIAFSEIPHACALVIPPSQFNDETIARANLSRGNPERPEVMEEYAGQILSSSPSFIVRNAKKGNGGLENEDKS